jgi:hypothetical protein
LLFDLRGSGRRRIVQIVYVTLAILMGGGLVLFGIGGSVSGGLVDAITQNQGGADTGKESYVKRVREAEARTKANPSDPAPYAALARARFQLASAGDNIDRNTGEFSAEGKRQLQAAATAWEKHLELAKDKPDDSVAGIMVQAYGILGDDVKAVQAQEVITEARPTAATFARLAILAYSAGQDRKGNLARKEALARTDADQRETLKAQIDEAKNAGAAGATPSG